MKFINMPLKTLSWCLNGLKTYCFDYFLIKKEYLRFYSYYDFENGLETYFEKVNGHFMKEMGVPVPYSKLSQTTQIQSLSHLSACRSASWWTSPALSTWWCSSHPCTAAQNNLSLICPDGQKHEQEVHSQELLPGKVLRWIRDLWNW